MSGKLAALAEAPFAEYVMALEVTPLDETGAERPVYITGAAALFTDPDDVPPNVAFLSVLEGGWDRRERSAPPRSLRGLARPSGADVFLSNRDGRLDEWLDWTWEGRPFVQKAGAVRDAAGEPYAFRDFETVFHGFVEALSRDRGGRLRLSLRGPGARFDQPDSSLKVYGGWGGAMEGAAPRATSPDDAALAPGSAGYGLEWIGRVDSLPEARSALIRRGTDLGIYLDLDGSAGFFYNKNLIVPAITSVDLKETIFLSVDLEPADPGAYWLSFYYGAGPDRSERILYAYVPFLPNVGGGIVLGEMDGIRFPHAVFEARVFSAARGLETVLQESGGPLMNASSNAKLAEKWTFGDGEGSIAAGSKGLLDLTLDAAGFAGSLEGDDPEQFGDASAAGEIIGRVYGKVFNAPGRLVDSQRYIYRLSDRPLTDLTRVRIAGRPLVPEESLFSDGNEDFETFSLTDTIVFKNGYDTKRFIPGQKTHSIPGQRIEIVNSGGADGVYRIAEEGISKDGRTIKLVGDDYISPANLPDLKLPAGTLFQTPADEVQFFYDLGSASVTLCREAEGDLTADCTGIVGAFNPWLLASEAFALIAGFNLTFNLPFDPAVGFVDAGEKREVHLERILDSALAYYREEAGDAAVETHETATGGIPDVLLTGIPAREVPSGDSAAFVGHIVRVEVLEDREPPWRIIVDYAPTIHVQKTGLVSGVDPALRERLGKPWRTAQRTLKKPSEREDVSKAPEEIETYIVERADAESLAARAAALLGSRITFYDLEVAGLPLVGLTLGQQAHIVHPDNGTGLSAGRRARILALEMNSRKATTTLEAYAR